jgi:hypothetical protein
VASSLSSTQRCSSRARVRALSSANSLSATALRPSSACGKAATCRTSRTSDSPGECDLNRAFASLPAKWQAGNLTAAEQALNAAYLHHQRSEAWSVGGARTSNEVVELIAEQVHQDWLARNAGWAPEELTAAYCKLPGAEQAKDRVIARRAYDAVRSLPRR